MSALSIQVPFPVFQDRDGQPLDNGYVWLGTSSLNPQTNPVVAYYDSALTIVATQPLRTLNGFISRAGSPAQVYVDAVNFSILVQDRQGTTVFSVPEGTGISPNASGVVYDPAGTGAVASTVQAKLRESVSVKDFGAAIGGTAAANTAAFNLAITDCKTNDKALEIVGGPYALTAGGVDFAGQGLQIIGVGPAILQFEGTGRGFVLNGGTAGSGIGEMSVENILIIGGPNITDGFYSTGVWRSTFKNIEVRECNNNAFDILHGVSNHYDSLKYSTNVVAQTTTPTNGLVLENSAAGYYTADCTFTNTVMEGFPGRGIYVVDASGNTFVGGTSESVSIGVTIATGCRRNHFIGLWCEANTTRDLEINSVANAFTDCYVGSNTPSGNNVEVTTGQGTVFRGGFVRIANLQVTSRDTSFLGVGFSSGLSGITGTGTYTRLGCTALDVNANVVATYPDVLGTVNSLTFPATQVPSSNVNTLDDYQEGTFTPVLTPAGGTITPNASYTGGRYTKIGNLVTVNGCVYVTSVAAPTGALSITGLPFVSKAGTTEYRAGSIFATDLNATATQPLMLAMTPSSATLNLAKLVSGVQTAMAPDVKAASDIRFSITYQTDEI